MSEIPTCKQWKTVKDEEAPNSLLSLPKEILQYCVAFVGKGHYWFVGSVWQGIHDEPAFIWWVPYVLAKHKQIVPAVNKWYHKWMHKYGIEIPNDYDDCMQKW
jgi:hypothetical protein